MQDVARFLWLRLRFVAPRRVPSKHVETRSASAHAFVVVNVLALGKQQIQDIRRSSVPQ